MKYRVRWLSGLLAACAVLTAQAEESASQKAARTTQKAGEVIEGGIQKGASAANRGLTKGFEAANDKVFGPADRWIQQKVNPQGQGKPVDKK